MSGPESNVAPWIRKAKNDLLNVSNNLDAEEIPWDTVCFHAQQAVEKLLKAFLVHHGVEITRTHDLVALLGQCVEFDPSLGFFESDCRRLTSYGVAARYPDDLFDPGEGEGVRWLGRRAGSVMRRSDGCRPREWDIRAWLAAGGPKSRVIYYARWNNRRRPLPLRSLADRRVRPIAMTASAVTFGLLPIMWTEGTGADVMQRIAASMIGGMVTTTVLALLLVPALYLMWRGRELGLASTWPNPGPAHHD